MASTTPVPAPQKAAAAAPAVKAVPAAKDKPQAAFVFRDFASI